MQTLPQSFVIKFITFFTFLACFLEGFWLDFQNNTLKSNLNT